MNKLTIGLLALVLLSGCVSARHDLSTGKDTALIESQDGFWSRCTIYGPLPFDLSTPEPPEESLSAGKVFGLLVTGKFNSSASTDKWHDSLVVDAGLVKIVTVCVSDDPFGGSVHYNAKFSFIAEAGHTYNFSGKGSDCYKLLDVTANGRVVACEPYFHGSYDDLSAGDHVATFINTNLPYSVEICHVNQGGVGRRTGLLEVDAGPITIHAICEKQGWWSNTKKTSSFDFIAEAEHTYRFTASKKECMGLLDITSGEKVIACNPYEDVK